MKIRLSAFADETSRYLNDQIRALNRNDVPFVELRSIDGLGVDKFTLEQAKYFRDKFNDNGIAVWSAGSPIGKVDINTNFDEYLDFVKHVCEVTKVLGAERIRMFSFFNAYNEPNKVFDYLNKIVEVGNQFELMMCHENEKDVYGDVVSRILEIKANVPGLKYIYDPANFIQCGQDVDESINTLVDTTEYFHIKDVVKETGELVPAGYGSGKLSEIVSRIKEDKVLTLEPHLGLFKGYENIDSTKLKCKFKYETPMEAFDCAVRCIKEIIINNGYKAGKGEFTK